MKAMRKIVIKIGTNALTQGTKKLSRRSMLGLVQQIAQLRGQGLELVIVSSGAIAAGQDLLDPKNPSMSSRQMFASVGQVKLIQIWSELFSLFELQVAQVLLTKDDFSLSKQLLTQETLGCLLQHSVIPIINENDTISTKEMCIHNDHLAAFTANLISADTVLLLTDQEGLYTCDPRLHPEAKLISVVSAINEEICAMAGASTTALGTGGMATKIEAAQIAAKSGAQTIIASYSRPNVLIDLVEGKQIGTLFLNNNRG